MCDDDFSRLFQNFGSEAFRFESLPEYSIPEEAESLRSYLEGHIAVTGQDEDWIAFLQRSRAAGKRVIRVRLVPYPLTDYFRFELDWGYLLNAPAGEEVRFVADANRILTNGQGTQDFWIFDHNTVVTMNYDKKGSFLGVNLAHDPETVERFQRIRETLLSISMSFEEFLSMYRTGRIT